VRNVGCGIGNQRKAESSGGQAYLRYNSTFGGQAKLKGGQVVEIRGSFEE